VPDITGKTIIVAGAHHLDRVVLDTKHRLRADGAEVVVQIVNDRTVDDMRTLADELLGHHPRIDVLAHVGTRHDLTRAVLQPYLLSRLLADRIAATDGRVLWSVAESHRTATFDPDAEPVSGRGADGTLQLARALLVHEWPQRDERLGAASFVPDAATLSQLCATDEPLDGGHFVDQVRVADAPATTDAALASRVWERCATATRLDP
jgi:hypothetical protein